MLPGAAGLVVALQSCLSAMAFDAYPHGGQGMPHGVVNDPHIFVAIDPDGTVTIVAHRSEMGTGSRTSLPMVVADELEADWSRVTIVQAPGDEPKYGNQDTDGSRSMRHLIQPMRQLRRRGAPDAGAGSGQPVGRAGRRGRRRRTTQVVHKPLGRKSRLRRARGGPPWTCPRRPASS